MKQYTFVTSYNNIHQCDIVEDFVKIDDLLNLLDDWETHNIYSKRTIHVLKLKLENLGDEKS